MKIFSMKEIILYYLISVRNTNEVMEIAWNWILISGYLQTAVCMLTHLFILHSVLSGKRRTTWMKMWFWSRHRANVYVFWACIPPAEEAYKGENIQTGSVIKRFQWSGGNVIACGALRKSYAQDLKRAEWKIMFTCALEYSSVVQNSPLSSASKASMWSLLTSNMCITKIYRSDSVSLVAEMTDESCCCQTNKEISWSNGWEGCRFDWQVFITWK